MTAATEPVTTGVDGVVTVGTGLPGVAGAVGGGTDVPVDEAAGEVAAGVGVDAEPEELLLPQPARRTRVRLSGTSARKGRRVTESPVGERITTKKAPADPSTDAEALTQRTIIPHLEALSTRRVRRVTHCSEPTTGMLTMQSVTKP
jgi:hypothetical protein